MTVSKSNIDLKKIIPLVTACYRPTEYSTSKKDKGRERKGGREGNERNLGNIEMERLIEHGSRTKRRKRRMRRRKIEAKFSQRRRA